MFILTFRMLFSTMKLQGTCTALITPFKEDYSIDWDTFETLVHLQAKAGNHLVPCGTTGESPTISHSEQRDLIQLTCDIAKDYPGVKVIAGIGSNDTRGEAVPLAEFALQAGADYGLSVIPYYNKPGQRGNIVHQKRISETGLPLIVYNIPGRCGGPGLSADTILWLSDKPGIAGLKAAAGVNDDLTKVLLNRPNEFSVLSGDDTLTFYMMAAGADGTISVASNVLPTQVHDSIELMLSKQYDKGFQAFKGLYPALKGNMSYGTNPESIKETAYIMRHQLGIPNYVPVLREPMMRLEVTDSKKLFETMKPYLSGSK